MIDTKALLKSLTLSDHFTIDGVLQRVIAIDRVSKVVRLLSLERLSQPNWSGREGPTLSIGDLAGMLESGAATWDAWTGDGRHPETGPVLPLVEGS